MFGLGKAYPYIDGGEIGDPRSDRKSAVKIGDSQFGDEAFYFYKDGTLYYIPYSAVTSAASLMMPEHHSCCSGGSTIDVPTVMVHCGGESVKLSYTSTESGDRAEKIIQEKISR